ncbi:TIGR02646 family protein [Lysobacteraceae bacterium NML07-0707]|nr:TIGR02646 family protein [Xanthomonadaceae bacterium NML07-0707]
MRVIRKRGHGGYRLNQAHSFPTVSPQDATNRWRSFAHKAEVMNYLLDEQYHLCCYSELRADEEGLGYHIEHIENKSQNPGRTFDYTNLAACALSSDDLEKPQTRSGNAFGGHARGKSGANGPVNMNQFILPHQANCARYFAYLSDGRIVPAISLSVQEKSRAQYTIDMLNLNCPFLVTRRRQWWRELESLEEEHLQKSWHLPDLIAINLLPINHKMYRFFSLTRQFFGPQAEQVLQQQAPELL